VLRLLPDRALFVREERASWGSPHQEVSRQVATIATLADLGGVLPDLLAEQARGVREIDVIVGDGFCRFLCIDRPSGTRALRDLDALARMRFQESFGDAIDDWRLLADRSPFSARDLVVAMPQTLIDVLEAGLKSEGKRTSRIAPFWVRCANASGIDAQGRRWVVASEPGTHTLALFDGHACIGIRRVRRADEDALDVLLAREQSLYAEADGSGAEPAVSAWGMKLPRIPGWRLVGGEAPRGVPSLDGSAASPLGAMQ